LNPIMIFDGHSDLARELVQRDAEANPFGSWWLPELRAGDVRLQVCAINTSARAADDPTGSALAQLSALQRAVADNAGDVRLVRTRADLDLVRSEGTTGIMLSIEGVAALATDDELLDRLHGGGVRMVGLCWLGADAFADGNLAERPGRGLTDRVRQLVDELLHRGIVLDLAHASDRTFADVLERSGDACLVVSHTACRALWDDNRNVTDEQIRSIAARGGVVGIAAISLFLDPRQPTVARMADHVLHVADVAGWEHVTLGGDFIRRLIEIGSFSIPAALSVPPTVPFDCGIDDLSRPGQYPALLEELRARGVAEHDLGALMWRNLERVLDNALQ
jgi:membrane dipeptidase